MPYDENCIIWISKSPNLTKEQNYFKFIKEVKFGDELKYY
jgi:hypothetical protein